MERAAYQNILVMKATNLTRLNNRANGEIFHRVKESYFSARISHLVREILRISARGGSALCVKKVQDFVHKFSQ